MVKLYSDLNVIQSSFCTKSVVLATKILIY